MATRSVQRGACAEAAHLKQQAKRQPGWYPATEKTRGPDSSHPRPHLHDELIVHLMGMTLDQECQEWTGNTGNFPQSKHHP